MTRDEGIMSSFESGTSLKKQEIEIQHATAEILVVNIAPQGELLTFHNKYNTEREDSNGQLSIP